MEMPGGRHVMLVGEGAERFVLGEAVAKKYQIEMSAMFISGPAGACATSATSSPATSGNNACSEGPGRDDLRFGEPSAPSRWIRPAIHGRHVHRRHHDDGPAVSATPRSSAPAHMRQPSLWRFLFRDRRIVHSPRRGPRCHRSHGLPKSECGRRRPCGIDQLPDEPGGVGGLIALDHDGRMTFAVDPRRRTASIADTSRKRAILRGDFREGRIQAHAEGSGDGRHEELALADVVGLEKLFVATASAGLTSAFQWLTQRGTANRHIESLFQTIGSETAVPRSKLQSIPRCGCPRHGHRGRLRETAGQPQGLDWTGAHSCVDPRTPA